jgi:hypothetical protein
MCDRRIGIENGEQHGCFVDPSRETREDRLEEVIVSTSYARENGLVTCWEEKEESQENNPPTRARSRGTLPGANEAPSLAPVV